MTHYYFFQPCYPRLNRAWKPDANLTNLDAGGHHLAGDDLRIFPTDFFLRHYIVLSEKQAHDKYVGRLFSQEDVIKGWHDNRRTITSDVLKVKHVPGLMKTSVPSSHVFDLSVPMTKHFWQW
jgi:hypothetical protein